MFADAVLGLWGFIFRLWNAGNRQTKTCSFFTIKRVAVEEMKAASEEI